LTTNLETRAHRRIRLALRGLVLIAAVVLAWPLRKAPATSVFLPALSPFLALGSALAVRSVSVLALLALPVLLLALVFKRWFCRYGCPVGLLQETVERTRTAGPKRWLRQPGIGKGIVLLTLGGACLGYPILLWMDPLALFNGFLNAWRTPLHSGTLMTGLGLPLVLLLAWVLPRLWCRKVCPLGAMQDLLADAMRCGTPRRTGRPACPAKSQNAPHPEPLPQGSCAAGESLQGAIRTGATRCPTESAPPDHEAVDETTHGAGAPLAGGFRLARRGFFTACAGAAGAFAIRLARGAPAPPLRPPGAIPEDRFIGVCVRCGNCARACPSRIIQPDVGQSGVAGWLTPLLRFEDDYCREDCHRCNVVCPSGALPRIPLADKRRRIIGLAKVDEETCLLANGRECVACLKGCPFAAIAMTSADGGFTNLPDVDRAKCNGCGACEAVCPVRPRRAIRVLPPNPS
jgi:MauM/NapG family ferredoxin protein